ncbi:MAG TPA: IS200/IS605 family transposase [Armatimonadota bacterium]
MASERDSRLSGNHTEVFIHFTWSTMGRAPYLSPDIREDVYACIRSGCARQGLTVVALNGIEDHVHLLVRMTTTTTVADVVRQAKGASSHFVNHSGDDRGFRWQDGYAAFSVSRWDAPKVAGYIANQVEHHRDGTTKDALEPLSAIG